MAVAVPVDLALELRDVLWSLRARPDEAHLTAEDVEQLGQLVDRGRAEERPEPRPAVVTLDPTGPDTFRQLEHGGVGGVGGVAAVTHRPELEDLERATV